MASHRTKDALRAIAFTLLLAGAAVARAGDYEDGLNYWRAHDYRGAYDALLRFRETPFGRNAQVDYMLGTSGCKLDEEKFRKWGRDYLGWMLHRYPLPDDCRDIVNTALRNCGAQSPSSGPPPLSVDRMAEVIGASARASGKIYYLVGKNEAFNNFAAVRVRQVDPLEFRKRLYPLDNSQRAIEATRARVPGYLVQANGRFVLAAKIGKTNENLLAMSKFLERYLAFLEREYSVTLPDTFVTVYLVPDPEEIAKLADHLHGLRLGRATMGYSFRDDMSILAVVPSGFTVGTIQHELFHLAVRSRFGDIPQWLDEGIASLYEVSKFERDMSAMPKPPGGVAAERCVGLPNWRGKVLWTFMGMRPSIEKIVTSDWYAFEQPDHARTKDFMVDSEEGPPSAELMAVSLATARYFALYLQEHGALKPLYERLRTQRPGDGPDAQTASLRAVSEVLGKPLPQIDAEFVVWFKKLPKEP